MIKNIKWNQFPRAALDALYPRRCPVCGEIVTPKGRLICPSCLLRLSPVQSPVCQKCGKEVWSAAAEKLRQYENREEWQFDGLVPVPVHPARKRKRGFNQAEVLAKRMGERLEMPVCPEFLYRIRNTEPLKELNPDERLRNLQQAFQADAEAIRASGVQNVLLVDDIYTTGSTAEACTRALLSAGIEKVCFFAVCIGHGR